MRILKIMLPFQLKLSRSLVVLLTTGLTVSLMTACQTTAGSANISANSSASNSKSASTSNLASHRHQSGYITGDVTQQSLLKGYPYFAKGYQNYQLTQQQVKQMKNLPSDMSLDIYFGTWCHDSQREVPRLLKALSVNPNITAKLIALDIRKQEPQGRAKASGVKYTPTIIVKLNGEEVGRIIERPKVDLVTDMLNFIR